MMFTVPLGLLLVGGLVGILSESPQWKCPDMNDTAPACLCDFPQTLRCSTNLTSMQAILGKLKTLPPEETISLLDFTVPNITVLPGKLLIGVSVHGLVLTSGELRNISRDAFVGLVAPLQALGLPNNKLEKIPIDALGVLTRLERLDLSYNRLTRLNSDSLKNLNLSFLDLSNNQITNITPDTFATVKNLTVIKLSQNKLTVANISALVGVDHVRELDLSGNYLMGPLEPGTLPSMSSLETLSLANNKFSSISQGALKGASNLRSLVLNHNQIDVLEDHSFKELANLHGLHLSNNRIVAISGSSFAHLTQLTELDLSHNFLRSLTADIIVPLVSLKILRLDDNDISLVESDTFRRNTSLDKLTLSDNPFSCDCNLVDFSMWLGNATKLSLTDRNTAVCMTPPHLENALVMEVPVTELRCEEDDYDLLMQEGPSATHISGSQIVLRVFSFNGTTITLLWSIDTKARSFSCDTLFVYEETSVHEVLLTSTPLKCNSSQMSDPTTLTVNVGLGSMQPFHRYRFCVVLVEDDKFTDEVQLVLGCSEIIPLVAGNHSIPQSPSTNVFTKITSLRANVSDDSLTIFVDLWNQKKLTSDSCQVTVSVFSMSTLLTQHLLNCTNLKVSISDLPGDTYQICASLDRSALTDRLQCITVEGHGKSETTIWLTVCFILFSIFTFLVLYIVYKKLVKRSKFKTAHQCFRASNDYEDHQHKQHSRYVKLQTAYNL